MTFHAAGKGKIVVHNTTSLKRARTYFTPSASSFITHISQAPITSQQLLG